MSHPAAEHDTPARPQWRRHIPLIALHGILCVLGLWSAFGGWILAGFDPSSSSGVDNRLNNYFLEHGYRVFLDTLHIEPYHGKLWSPPMFHPIEGTLAYSDNLLGLAPVYWLLRIALEPWHAFQGWVAFGFVGTYLAMAWACRRLGAAHVVAAVAAFLFAFGMPRLAQHMAAHSQLVPQIFAPLAIVAAWSFVRRPRHGALAMMLLLLLLQKATAIYTGWFLLLGFAVAAPLALASVEHLRQLGRYLRRGWLVALLIILAWGLAKILLLYPYLVASRGFEGWGQQYIANTLPRWHSYLRPAPDTLWWPVLQHLSHDDGNRIELHLFIGAGWLPFLILAVVAVAWGRTPWTSAGRPDAPSADPPPSATGLRHLVIVLLAVAALLTLASFRLPTGHSPWWHLHKLIPGGDAIRSVSRIWSITYLFALVGTAVGVSVWLREVRKSQRGLRRLLLAGACMFAGLAVVEQVRWHDGPSRHSHFDAQVAETLANLEQLELGRGEAFFLFPPPAPVGTATSEHDVNQAHMIAMWVSLRSGMPTVNGYSARAPAGYPADRTVPPAPVIVDWVQDRTGRPPALLELQPIESAHDRP